MHVKKTPSWAIKESEVTPESTYLNRKQFMKGIGATMIGGGLLAASPSSFAATTGIPAKRNPIYKVDEPPISKEELATNYNNFYEFTTDKGGVTGLVKDWNIDNWKIEIGGLVDKPKTYDVEELVKLMSLEERVYRFRCVETWSAVIPWTGFTLAQLIKFVQPQSKAKFVKFTTFKPLPSLSSLLSGYPWPYVEGLRMDEAMNELTLIGTGMYGKPMPRQNGAPIRVITPWKYGYKSIKSIVKIEFVDKQPLGLWEEMAPREYGFYSNVNPNVDHPRWSQKREKPIGNLFQKRDTLIFNGYEEQVASLYKGMDLRKFH